MDGKIDLTKMTEAFKVLAAALMEANRITIDYGEITRKTMEVMKEERERIWKDIRLRRDKGVGGPGRSRAVPVRREGMRGRGR